MIQRLVGRLIFLAKKALGREKLFEDLKRLLPPSGDSNSKNVLIYTYKWWPQHLAAEAILGRALEQRGASVSFFACDRPKGACDNFILENSNYMTCAQCLDSREKFLDGVKFETLTVNRYLRPEDRVIIEKAAATDDLDELRRIEVDGIHIGRAAEASAIRYLRVNSLYYRISESLPVMKGYVKNAMETYLVCDRMFKEKKFDAILLQCGKSCSEAVLVDTARKHKVPYMTYDFGFILGTLMFRSNDSISETDVRPVWEHFKDRSLTEAQNAELDQYLADRQFGRKSVINQWPNPKFDGIPFDAEGVHRKGGRVFVAFTNVAWDTAWIGMASAFPTMFDWLEETVRLFIDRPNDCLIVRIHPAEVRMSRGVTREAATDFLARRFPNLPPNIRIVTPDDSLSSYSLIPPADGILVYTSTIGLEAAAMGKPVLAGCSVHYHGFGFTWYASNAADYRRYLDQWGANEAVRDAEAAKSLARRYCYLLFFKLMVPFRPLSLEGDRFLPRIGISSPDEVAPGKDPYIDEICDGILNSHPIFVRS